MVVSETEPLSVDNDELSIFVSSTLRAIAAGVEEAARMSQVESSGGRSSYEMPDKVGFDVAVTAKRSGETSKGLKIEVFKVGGGLEGERSDGNETVSRIQFEVGWKYTHTASIRQQSGNWQA